MVWAILGVIAFLVFLVVFPKFTIGYIVVIGLVIGVMLYAIDQRKKERERINSKIIIEITYAPEKCSEEFPLLTTIHNGTQKTINKWRFYLVVNRKDHSSNILDYSYDGRFENDKILSPGEFHGTCYRLPKLNRDNYDLKELIYSIDKTYYEFASE